MMVLVSLLACAPLVVGGDGPLVIDDTGAGTAGDAGSTADGGTGDGGTGDGGTSDGGSTDGGTGDGGVGTGVLHDISAVEHDEVTTLLTVTWTQDVPSDAAWITFSYDDVVLTTPAQAREAGTHSEVLIGIPEETQVDATITLETGSESLTSVVFTGETGSLPGDVLVPDLVQYDEAHADSSPWFLTAVNVGNYDFYGPCYVLILDRQGRVVWYEEVDDSRLTWQPRPSLDGNSIVYEASTYYVYTSGVEPGITRLTLDKTQKQETFIEGMGLAWAELSDGSYVFDHAESGYDYHLERLYPDGERQRLWSCYPWMSDYTREYWGCAANALVVDPDEETVIYSMFETSTVARVDLNSGELLGWWGQTPDAWETSPADSVFDLQHYPNFSADGNLVVSTHARGGGSAQYVREFEIQGDNSIEQVWSYALPPGYYAEYAGGGMRLDEGNTIITVGTDGFALEVTPDGDVVWELDFDGHLLGNVLELDDLYALNEGW